MGDNKNFMQRHYMRTGEVENASRASSFFHYNWIFCITKAEITADPNMHDVTTFVKIVVQLFQGKCYKLCYLNFSRLLCQASGGKSSVDEPLKHFCALPF